MSRYYKIFSSLAVLCATGLLQPLYSQQKINPTLEVKRDFDARLLEIQKGKLNTTYSDTVGRFNLLFDYSIFDKPIKDLYEFSPLPSAQIERGSNLKYPVFYGNIGMDIPFNPHLDLYLQPNLPSSLSLTVYGKHNSFWGKIPLVNVDGQNTARDKQKVSAPSAQNNLGLDFGYNWKNGELGVNIDYSKDFFSFYGYNPVPEEYSIPIGLDGTLLPEKFTSGYMRDTLSHVYDKFRGRFYIRSTNNRPNSFFYNIDFGYTFLGDKGNYEAPPVNNVLNSIKDFDENYLNIGGVAGQNFARNHKFMVSFRYQTSNGTTTKSFNRSDMEIHPYYTFSRNRWIFELGIKFNKYTNPSVDAFNIFFKGNVSYELLKNRLWFYALADGKNNFQTYQNIMSVNPWITPNIDIQNTEEPLIAKIGFKGQIKDRFSYNIYGGYNKYVKQMNLFYYSNMLYGPRNTFIATYKDMHKFGFGGELFWKSKEFESGLSFKYNDYTNKNSSTVYNYPPFELRAFGRYNWRERIVFGASLHFRSKTHTLFYFDPYNNDPSAVSEYISQFTSVNLDVTYVLNNKVSLYLKLNNILDTNELYSMYYGGPGAGIGFGAILRL
ncbi:MAG: hypothetical protein ABFC28_00400 [Rikenellaceae bacterium]